MFGSFFVNYWYACHMFAWFFFFFFFFFFLRGEGGPIICLLGLVNFELKKVWVAEKVGSYLSRTSFFSSNEKVTNYLRTK